MFKKQFRWKSKTIKLRKKLGKIFEIKHFVNLEGKFLEMPQFIEENEVWETIYEKV